MSTQRIEIAEVVSFRLTLPSSALEHLAQTLAPELPLGVDHGEAEVFLRTAAQGESFLRFRTVGANAVLTQISISNDPRGVFFHRVVGALLLDHGGDLHVRLVWNDSDRNLHGGFAEVVVQGGRSTYPDFTRGSQRRGNQLEPGAAPPFSPSASEDDSQVGPLLSRARAQWQEYQRLKAARGQS
jgi:hypothetical protein